MIEPIKRIDPATGPYFTVKKDDQTHRFESEKEAQDFAFQMELEKAISKRVNK